MAGRSAVTLPTTLTSEMTFPVDGTTFRPADRDSGYSRICNGVDRVEMSTRRGHYTGTNGTGKESWRYDWVIPGDDTYTILSRVIDLNSNIETPGPGVTITIDSNLPTTSGPLTADETWSGEVTLSGDVTVPAGVTLTLEPGTRVLATPLSDEQSGGNNAERIELIVQGSLSAVGTSLAPSSLPRVRHRLRWATG